MVDVGKQMMDEKSAKDSCVKIEPALHRLLTFLESHTQEEAAPVDIQKCFGLLEKCREAQHVLVALGDSEDEDVVAARANVSNRLAAINSCLQSAGWGSINLKDLLSQLFANEENTSLKLSLGSDSTVADLVRAVCEGLAGVFGFRPRSISLSMVHSMAAG